MAHNDLQLCRPGRRWIIGLSLGLLLAAPLTAAAQATDPSLVQLPRLDAVAGETVWVHTRGLVRKGIFVGQAADAIEVLFDGKPTPVAATDILVVELQVRDGVTDGVLRGLLYGASLGGLYGIAAHLTCDNSCRTPPLVPYFIALGAGAGAGVGALVDFANRARVTIYRGRVTSSIRIAPALEQKGIGATFAVTWGGR